MHHYDNSLSALYAENNNLTDLPDGLLEGLSLSELILYGNPGAPFQIEVTLESDGGNEVRVSVPIGAPTNFDVPLTATNGTVDGTTTKTISVDRGAVASAPIIVERNAGSTAPVSATLGAISVTIPDDHNGYAFALSTQTTFEIMAEASVVSAPTDLTAQPDGPNEIVLAWTAPEDDVTAPIAGYRIEVSTDGETWTVAVMNTASTDTTYMHARRVAGTTYYYRVRAVNAAGPGAASNEASAMTTALTGVCARTPAVVIEIERATATDCSLVSANQLAAITEIDLATHAPTALLSGDFGGMSGLTTLDLGSGLSALPPDLLAGLTSLTSITASGGSITTLPSSLFRRAPHPDHHRSLRQPDLEPARRDLRGPRPARDPRRDTERRWNAAAHRRASQGRRREAPRRRAVRGAVRHGAAHHGDERCARARGRHRSPSPPAPSRAQPPR